MDPNKLTDRELLRLYGQVLDTLRLRGTTRSANNPVADYAEGLCKKALNLTLAAKSTTGYDGTDPSGHKIEVKARRITKENGSRQLSAIRGIGNQHFDYLAGVLFNADFSVMRGCLIPYAVVKEHGKHVEHSLNQCGIKKIVMCEKFDELSGCTLHASVVITEKLQILLVDPAFDAFVFFDVFVDDFLCAIGRTIIGNQQLEVAKRLGKRALDCLSKIVFAVVDGQAY